MSEMVERISEVICEQVTATLRGGGILKGNGAPARAVIAAMREPTEAMLKRFNDERPSGYDPGDNYIGTEDMRELWGHMIDEALKG